MTVVLFVISLAALERSPGFRSILLSLALGLFSLKNIVLTYLFFIDDLPDIHPLMFADAVVTGAIFLRLLITGTVDSVGKEGGKDGEDNVGEGTGVPESDQEPAMNLEKPLTAERIQPAEGQPTPEEPPGD